MATPGRTINFDLERTSLHELLEREPFRFEFFQAVRLLQRISSEREGIGRFVHPSQEAVRFSARASAAFPASEIHGIDWPHDRPPRMLVNFMGLIGPEGVLPLAYTEFVMERLRAKDTGARDFFDIFNHRMISLFYKAWEKYRVAATYERGEPDRISAALVDLIGLGTEGL